MADRKESSNKLIGTSVFRELLFASAEAASLPIEVYVNKLVSDKEFVSPSLSREKIVLVKLRVLLFHLEKELEKAQAKLVKLQQMHQDLSSNTFLQAQIQDRIKLLEELLEKLQKLRLNLNYYLG